MPILVLLLISVAAGFLIGLAFDRLAPAEGATAAAAEAVEHAVESSALRTWWRARTDPAVATGLALSAAVAVIIAGGFVIGALAYLIRGNAALADIDSSAAQWGNDHATELSTRVITWITDLGDWPIVPLVAIPILIYELRRRPNLSVLFFLVLVYAGDKLITKYHHQGYQKPIFYPVNAPSGVPLTRAWPLEKGAKNETTDHPHQKSAWWCHGDVIAEGTKLKNSKKGIAGTDFWSEGKASGKIVATKVEVKKKDKNHIVVVTTTAWMSADDEKILDETYVVQLHQLDGAWLIVCESDLSAPTYNIIFDDTKEGSFGVRMNDQIASDKKGKSKGKIENAEGKIGETNCWGRPSAWCDYSGPISGKTYGIALFDDPKNPGSPTPFHVRDFGLLTHIGIHDWTLKQDQSQSLRHRLLFHNGDAKSAKLDERYREFTEGK